MEINSFIFYWDVSNQLNQFSTLIPIDIIVSVLFVNEFLIN